MPSETPPSRGLSPLTSLLKTPRILSRRSSKSSQREDTSPNPDGLLVPPTSRSSESGDSLSIRSTTSRGRRRTFFHSLGLRSRSSSRVDGVRKTGPGPLQKTDFENIEGGWIKGFDLYNQLITNQISTDQSYSTKKFEEICKVLTKRCGERFLHGLPEAVFDLALLWCPAGRTRRESLDPTEPSWSWTGWKGAVNFPFDPTNCPDVRAVTGDYFRSEIDRFEVGPGSAPYTVRRAVKEKSRIGYHSQFRPLNGTEPPSEEGTTLRFSAFTIPAEDFDLEQLDLDDGTLIPCTHLLDTKGEQAQLCGVMMEYKDELMEDVMPSTFEYVLLSRNRRCKHNENLRRPATNTAYPSGTPIWDGARFIWDMEVNDFDDNVYEAGEWKMLNVMMIQRVHGDDFSRRVAIGRIHEDAWKARNPVKKGVVLR